MEQVPVAVGVVPDGVLYEVGQQLADRYRVPCRGGRIQRELDLDPAACGFCSAGPWTSAAVVTRSIGSVGVGVIHPGQLPAAHG